MSIDFPLNLFHSTYDMMKTGPVSTNRTAGKRVMVVDDDDDFRLLLCDRLQRLGLECVEAENGEDAKLQLKSFPVDLVVTDNRMPKMDGLELIEWMRQNRHQVLIIFVTGDLTESVRGTVEKAQVYAIVEKPCSLSELSLKIEEALQAS